MDLIDIDNLREEALSVLTMHDDMSEDSPSVNGQTYKARREASKKNETEFVTLHGIEWEKYGVCTLEGCDTVSATRCKFCPTVFYCSKEHQEQDWASHKPNCKLVIWDEEPDSEDDLVARVKKTLKPGTELFSKRVLFSCPRYPTPTMEEQGVLQMACGQDRPRPCMECQQIIIILPKMGIYAEKGSCKDCGWPLHGTCYDGPEHRAECQIFRENNVTWSPDREHLLTLGGILRGYLMREQKPETWTQIMALRKRSPLNPGFIFMMRLAKVFLQDDCHMEINEPDLNKFIQIFMNQRINCGGPFLQLKRFTTVICQGGLPFGEAYANDEETNVKGEVFLCSQEMRMRFIATEHIRKNSVIKLGHGGGLLSV